MSAQLPRDPWEQWLYDTAQALPYPPTPTLRGALQLRTSGRRMAQRRVVRPQLAWLVVILVVLGGLLAVPQVRAGVWAILRIGVIEISPPQSIPTALPAVEATGAIAPPTPTLVRSLLDLAGETTLADARERMPLPIILPTYPADLGPPDKVFMQELGGPAVVLVWLDPANPARVRLGLQILSSNAFAQKTLGSKSAVTELQLTTVNGHQAAWVQGQHLLQFRDSKGQVDYGLRRLVDGNVLVWTQGLGTYRLETDVSLAEAIKIAEALR